MPGIHMRSNDGVILPVTPSDSNVLANLSWLRIGGAGNLVIEGVNGVEVTLAVPAGEYVPFTGGKVKIATTATGIVAFG